MRLLPNARIVVLAAFAALASCDHPTQPTPFTNLDYLLAESSGALSGAPIRLVTAPPPAAPDPPFANTCDYDAVSMMFVCPTQTVNGGTYNTAYQLLDANNQPLATRDTANTAAVRTVRTSDFTTVLPGDTTHLSIHNVIRRTLSGLLDDERIVNSQDTIIRLIGFPNVYKLVPEYVSVSNFRPRTTGLPSSFPQSGTISVSSTAIMLSDSSLVPTSAVMTFNGSATVTWARSYNGQLSTCTYDYASGVVQCT